MQDALFVGGSKVVDNERGYADLRIAGGFTVAQRQSESGRKTC